MDSDDLTREQAKLLRDQVGELRVYLNRLVKRMDKRRFPPQDPLRLKVYAAQDALHSLWVDLHYRSVKMGLGDHRGRQGELPSGQPPGAGPGQGDTPPPNP